MRGALKLGGLVAKLGGGRILRDRYASSLEQASGDPSWIDRRTLGRYLRNIDRDIPLHNLDYGPVFFGGSCSRVKRWSRDIGR